MKAIFSKKLWSKFLVAIMIMFSLMWLAPEPVNAGDGLAGKMAAPVIDFFVGIGDGVVKLIHYSILKQETTLLVIDNSEPLGWKIFKGITTALLVTAGAALSFCTFGLGGVALLSVVLTTGLVLNGAVGGFTGTKGNVGVNITLYDDSLFEDIIVLPIYRVTPEEIFGGQIGLFNVNFFKKFSNESDKELDIAKELTPVISKWYSILRNIAVVAMLSILVYMGIRIMLSSSSSNKAKYKQMMVDWTVRYMYVIFNALWYGFFEYVY